MTILPFHIYFFHINVKTEKRLRWVDIERNNESNIFKQLQLAAGTKVFQMNKQVIIMYFNKYYGL